jgi:hypothetical protein
MKYFIVPFVKLHIAVIATILLTFKYIIILYFELFLALWNWKWEFSEYYIAEYKHGIFSYLVDNDTYDKMLYFQYKTPFHWALNIDGVKHINREYIFYKDDLSHLPETEKLNFKQFIEKC